jgi:hypothetical protein
MEVFNEVLIPCPNCGTLQGICSKVNKGNHVWNLDDIDIPIETLADVANTPLSCDECDTEYILRVLPYKAIEVL